MKIVTSIMLLVLLTLIPAFAVRVYFWGVGTLVVFIISLSTSIVIEIIASALKKHKLFDEVSNGSGLVTVALLTLSLPTNTPAFVVIITTFFAIFIGKQVYGGMGQNIFNPAMVGMAVFIITYPQFATYYSDPSVEQSFQSLITTIQNKSNADAFTAATPLTNIKGMLHSSSIITPELKEYILSVDNFPWLVYTGAITFGGIVLLLIRVSRLSMCLPVFIGFGTVAFIHMIFGGETSELFYSYNLASLCLCAFFISTDPVTGPQDTRGRIIFAFILGVLIYIIRAFSNYNDGVAFAVLISNMLTPLLDTLIKPKEYGT